MIIFADVEENICNIEDEDFSSCVPDFNKIEKMNNLYEKGHHIVYWSSKPKNSTIWFNYIIERFKNWNVKYHELRLTKPSFDLYVHSGTCLDNL